MANGYDTHSLKATGMNEAASSSDTAPMVAMRDKRFTRTGIGFRSQAKEATSLNPGNVGQTPPPIVFGSQYLGGVASRKRGQVDESKLPWETAQEATSPQIQPRVTLPPSGLREALPPWLKDREDDDADDVDDDDDGDSDDDDRPGRSRRSRVRENDDWDGSGDDCDTGFPDEEDARDALSTLSQFVDGGTLKAIQNQIAKQYGDPGEEGEADAPVPGFMGEAASALAEAPLDAKKRNNLDSSDFALPGRKYPIPDESHARSALQRVQQFGSDEDIRKVKAAVRRKFPNMDVS
jgi:hypothetical protein